MSQTYACALPPLAQLGAYLLLILISGLAGYAAARAANAREIRSARSDGYHDAIRDRVHSIDALLRDEARRAAGAEPYTPPTVIASPLRPQPWQPRVVDTPERSAQSAGEPCPACIADGAAHLCTAGKPRTPAAPKIPEDWTS